MQWYKWLKLNSSIKSIWNSEHRKINEERITLETKLFQLQFISIPSWCIYILSKNDLQIPS